MTPVDIQRDEPRPFFGRLPDGWFEAYFAGLVSSLVGVVLLMFLGMGAPLIAVAIVLLFGVRAHSQGIRLSSFLGGALLGLVTLPTYYFVGELATGLWGMYWDSSPCPRCKSDLPGLFLSIGLIGVGVLLTVISRARVRDDVNH